MSSNPKVSIIIPAYNSEDTIRGCLDSILSQTEEKIEVIVVDDGSEDQTEEICSEYAQKDTRLQLITQHNSGPGPARNRGIENATGEYLYFVDSDDMIHRDLFSDNYKVASEKKMDIVVFGYLKTEWHKGKKVEVKTRLKKRELIGDEEIKHGLSLIFNEGATFAVWNKFFRRELIEENRIRFPDMRRNQDMIFTLKALKRAASVKVNPKVYYQYSFEAEAQKHDPDLIEHHMKVYAEFYNLRPNWMKSEANRRYACKLFLLYFLHSVPYFIIHFEDKPIKRLRQMVTHEEFITKINELTLKSAGNTATKLALILLKIRSPYLLFFSVKLKEKLSSIVGKNKFRRFFNAR